MSECSLDKCDVVCQLKRINRKITILSVMFFIMCAIVLWGVLMICSVYDFSVDTTTITIDSSNGTGSAIYQNGEGNIINGESDSENNNGKHEKKDGAKKTSN